MKKVLRSFFYILTPIAVIVALVLNLNIGPQAVVYAYTLDERGQLPGEFRGNSSVVDIARSHYKDTTVEFTEETNSHTESIKGMIGIRLEPSVSDLGVTISNLEPNTTYYKYVDHLYNKEEINTDESGTVAFANDTSQESYIMIFEHPSTYFIRDNSTGGDCATFASWSTITKTCKLTGNVTQSIEIVDSGITLDGNTHAVQDPEGDGNIGVFVNGGFFDNTNITVKNITVEGFAKGVQLNNVNNVILDNVVVSGNVDGIEFYRANESSVFNSNISSNSGKGLIIGTSSDINAISGNTINSNGVGVDLGLNSASAIFRNDIKLNGNGIAVSAIGGNETYLWQNNIDNTEQVSILFDGDTQFFKDATSRGNYWKDHDTCTPSDSNPNICTGVYTIPVQILPDKHDNYPWACEDAWLSGVDCPYDPGNPDPPTGGTGEVELFTQIESPFPSIEITRAWSQEEYANGNSETYSCGKTIASCGCALTSTVMVLRSHGITNFADGEEVTPSTLNRRLKTGEGADPSRVNFVKEWGYRNGNIGFDIVPYLVENRISWKGSAYGASELDSQLENYGPAIAYIKGEPFSRDHFIVIDDKLVDTYQVKDPSWYSTLTLNDARLISHVRNYNNTFANLKIYREGSGQYQRMLVTGMESPAEFVITDPLGNRLGFDPLTGEFHNEIVGGSYARESISDSQDPISQNPHVTKRAYILNPVDGEYMITVIGTGSGDYSLYSYSHDLDGNDSTETTNTITENEVRDYSLSVSSFEGVTILSDLTYPSKEEYNDKMEICHIPHGNPSKSHVISLSPSAWKAHAKHGDYEGECD